MLAKLVEVLNFNCFNYKIIFSHRKLIGVVINTTFCWNNETAILSLVADFRDIAREFIQRISSKIIKVPSLQPPTKCESKNVIDQ